MSVALVGPFYRDCYGYGEELPAPVGLTEMRIGAIMHGEPNRYKIDQNHKMIGWAPESSLRPRAGAKIIKEGFRVFVEN
jgi:hypothetical protein